MGELVRNNLFPFAEEVSALALEFGAMPGEPSDVGRGTGHIVHTLTEGIYTHVCIDMYIRTCIYVHT